MKLESLRDVSKEDVLGALGLATRRSSGEKWTEGLAWFGAGLALGAVVALVFAPKSGRALREDVGARFRTVRNKASETIGRAMDKAERAAERALSEEEGPSLT
jgi:gas vesicle protein